MGCTKSFTEQFAVAAKDLQPHGNETDDEKLPDIVLNGPKPEKTESLDFHAPNSCKHDGLAMDFWAATDQETVKVIKKKRKRKKMTKIKKTDWKYTHIQHEVKPLSDAAHQEKAPTVRAGLGIGKLLSDIEGYEQRKDMLEDAHTGVQQKMLNDVRAMKMKRELTMKKLNPEEFKTAQEAVSRALLKQPEDYEHANCEDTESLMKAMNVIFRDKSSKTLSGTKKEKFVNLLLTAGVLKADMVSKTWEAKEEATLKEIDMNASSFLHSAGEYVRDTFVSSVSELITSEPTFEVVKFSYGALKQKHVLQLAPALATCKNLKHLYLDSNDFGNYGVLGLLEVLRNTKDTLITLSLQNLPVWQTLSTEVLQKFVEAIEETNALVRLGFDLKEFRHREYMDRVSKHLKKNFDKVREARLIIKLKQVYSDSLTSTDLIE